MTEPRKRPEPSDAQRRFANGGGNAARRAAAMAAARSRRASPERQESLRLSVEAALRDRERAIVKAWRPGETGDERP
jgi:hypothetical protein